MKFLYLFIIGLLLFSSACSSLQNFENKSLFTVDQDQVLASEFVYVYQKNNFNRANEVSTREDINNYLDLFINFKLKVKEAESQGLHQTDAFKSELEGYRKQLAKPYLTETAVTEQLARQAYDRLKEEVKASHILIDIPESGIPEDTISSYQKALSIRERALKGESFSELAAQYSKDPSAASNGGNLGYFSAFQMVYPFEEAAFNTEVGDISQPVRTRFGYHLVKVLDRRAAQGKVKVSHIMIRAAEGITDLDSLSASKQAHEIYQRLQNGGDWEKLCQQFSDDLSTRSKSGSLPWLGTGQMNNIPTFERAAFKLEQIGDISTPVQTPYGWHIIRLDEKKGLEPYEDMAQELMAKIAQDSRSQMNQKVLIERLKNENQFVEFSDNKIQALGPAADSLFLGYQRYDSSMHILDRPIFSIKEQLYLVKDLYNYVGKNSKPGNFQNADQAKELLYRDFSESRLVEYEEEHLAEKYDDYRLLLQEYRDGILLFQLMDQMVWNKAIKDTLGFNEFFESHREQYYWNPRAKATIYSTTQPSVLEQVRSFLNMGYYENGKFDFARSVESVDTMDVFSEVEYKILDRIIVQLKQNPGAILNVSYSKSWPVYNRMFESLLKYFKNNRVPDSQIVHENGLSEENKFLLKLNCLSAKCLEIALNEKDPLSLKVEEGLYEKGDQELVDQVNWEPGVAEINDQEQFHLINILEILPESPKDLKEIQGQVISDYQTKLEQDWVGELRKTYSVNVNKNVLESTIKHLED